MTRFSMRIKILILLNLILLCSLIILFFKGGEQRILTAKSPPSLQPFLVQGKIKKAVVPTNFLFINQNAVFHKSRQKIAEPKPIQKKTEIKKTVSLNNFTLKGIIFKHTGKSTVYIYNKNTRKNMRLHLGDSFEGWKIKDVFKSYITLERKGQLSQLNLLKT